MFRNYYFGKNFMFKESLGQYLHGKNFPNFVCILSQLRSGPNELIVKVVYRIHLWLHVNGI